MLIQYERSRVFLSNQKKNWTITILMLLLIFCPLLSYGYSSAQSDFCQIFSLYVVSIHEWCRVNTIWFRAVRVRGVKLLSPTSRVRQKIFHPKGALLLTHNSLECNWFYTKGTFAGRWPFGQTYICHSFFLFEHPIKAVALHLSVLILTAIAIR